MKRLLLATVIAAATISSGCSNSSEIAAFKSKIEELQSKDTDRESMIDSLTKQLAVLTSSNESLSKTVGETAGTINSLKLERTPSGTIIIDSLVVREFAVTDGTTVRATMAGTNEGCSLVMTSPDSTGKLQLTCINSVSSVRTTQGDLELISSCRDELAGFIAMRGDTARLASGIWKDNSTRIFITDENGDSIAVPPVTESSE